MAPSDPIRVTRAVRRCLCWCHRETTPGEGVCHCSDGWVNVPVDEKCEWCIGDGWGWSGVEQGNITCPDCGGSGRRLHDWATGWCYRDEVMDQAGNVWRLAALGGMHPNFPDDHTLVLADPSHRPEPMRWKQ